MPKGTAHQSARHDSARKHVTGEALFIDDMAEPLGLLHVCLGYSHKAHAKVTKLDLEAVRQMPGVVLLLEAADIPGRNEAIPGAEDDPVFAREFVHYVGQPLFAVAGESLVQARRAVEAAIIDYEELPAILDIAQARAAQSELEEPQVMAYGDSKKALEKSEHRLRGRLTTGAQDHFYLEGQIALALPQEDGDVLVHSSTQAPTDVQHVVAGVLGVPYNAVTVEVRRMGGAFGGKESQAARFAAVAALVAVKSGRAAKLRLDREEDMVITGKRHDFQIGYDVGFDGQGRIEGIEFDLASRCGHSMDLSRAVNDRTMFHVDNCYFLENVTVTSHRYKTHTVSNTAFRGFGAPQGMIGIERVMDAIAAHLECDALEVRKINLYGQGERNITPYHQKVEDNVMPEMMAELEQQADYAERRAEIRAFNAQSPYLKKGIALTPVKFGVSFTQAKLNQAGALIHIYSDGSVHLNHGGTEMGQGLFVKVAQVVAEEFQIDLNHIKITATSTGKVPNSSPTAASSGSDLNGMAALDAARRIKARLVDFAAQHFDCAPNRVSFQDNHVLIENRKMAFADFIALAYEGRISLSSTGYYKTPKIHFDRTKHKGRPYYYYVYGAAVSEVVIDVLTGENKVVRVDILHESGRSLNPEIDKGQIEGAFIQGMGWLTTEEVVFDEGGVLLTDGPSTYKIPTVADRPKIFNLALWEKGENREETVYRSKAVGEPPLMLALSVFSALTDAVASVADYKIIPPLDAPATPEAILRAVEEISEK